MCHLPDFLLSDFIVVPVRRQSPALPLLSFQKYGNMIQTSCHQGEQREICNAQCNYRHQLRKCFPCSSLCGSGVAMLPRLSLQLLMHTVCSLGGWGVGGVCVCGVISTRGCADRWLHTTGIILTATVCLLLLRPKPCVQLLEQPLPTHGS